MLGRNFIKINSTTIPTPATYTGSPTNIEDVNESEAGTERVVVTRLLKRGYSFTFQVSEFWRQQLLTYGAMNSVSLQIGLENAMTGRFRIVGDDLVKNSNMTQTAYYTVRATFNQI